MKIFSKITKIGCTLDSPKIRIMIFTKSEITNTIPDYRKAMMDGFDNNYSDSDECKTNDGEETLHMCKECGAEFDFNAKGVSRLKELCSKCHGSAIDYLLADGNGPLTATAHASGVAEKVAGEVNKEILPLTVFTTSHTIVIIYDIITNTAAATR